VVVCEILVPELPVPIPVLTNERWSERREGAEENYLYGFQFVY